MIGVPFGPAVDKEFDKFIDEFVDKWGAEAEAYRTGKWSQAAPKGQAAPEEQAKRKSAIKGRMPVWVACLQAMRSWPSIDPGAVRCPTLLLAGTRNKGTVRWIEDNRPALERANVQVALVEGLDHPQEFSQVEQVYPIVASFLQQQG